MGNVGGDPASMTGGAATLHTNGADLQHMRAGMSSAGAAAAGAVGEATLEGAVQRFSSAWSQMLGDTGLQVSTAAQLAANASADLSTAGGGH